MLFLRSLLYFIGSIVSVILIAFCSLFFVFSPYSIRYKVISKWAFFCIWWLKITLNITINIDEDPAYYQSLSEKLENIIRENQGRWEQLELDLMSFRDSVVNQREQEANTEGLSLVEFAFFNLLTSEVKNIFKKEDLDISQREEIKEMVKELVQKMDEASKIVNFFKDQNAIKRVQLEIRRTIINSSFDSSELRKIITEEFMELAKVHFNKNQG